MDVSSGYTNVQSKTGHAWWIVQNAFPNHDLSSPWVPNREWEAVLVERGLQKAIFSGEMNARIEDPFKTVASYEKGLFRSPFPYSQIGALVYMDASSFNCNSGAINIRQVNEQRREIGREKGMNHEKWLSVGLPITDPS